VSVKDRIEARLEETAKYDISKENLEKIRKIIGKMVLDTRSVSYSGIHKTGDHSFTVKKLSNTMTDWEAIKTAEQKINRLLGETDIKVILSLGDKQVNILVVY